MTRFYLSNWGNYLDELYVKNQVIAQPAYPQPEVFQMAKEKNGTQNGEILTVLFSPVDQLSPLSHPKHVSKMQKWLY